MATSFFLASCHAFSGQQPELEDDNKIVLNSDSLNVVKLTDTLVIYEGTCRGCAVEGSTHFEIADSMNLVELLYVETIDNNPPDMDGGSVAKNLVLVPRRTGSTVIKMYKFWSDEHTAEDSANATNYAIEVLQ